MGKTYAKELPEAIDLKAAAGQSSKLHDQNAMHDDIIKKGRNSPLKSLKSWITKAEIKNSIFTAIIAAIITTLLMTGINIFYDSFKERYDFAKAVQYIYIGSNKEWIDSKLGPANFLSIQDNYMECVHISDTIAVTIFYEVETSSCCGYFVTILKKDRLFPVTVPDTYSWITDGKPIDEISYYDIDSVPINIYGYVSNGTGRAFYGEEYYYASSGNYYDFLFASVDYGDLQMTYSSFSELLDAKWSDEPIDDEVLVTHGQVLADRKSICPNTYGIIDSSGITDLFSSYHNFDSFQLRDKSSSAFR